MSVVADGDYLFDHVLENMKSAFLGRGVLSGMAVGEASTPDKTVDVATGSCYQGSTLTETTIASAESVDLSSYIDTSYPKKVLITVNSSGTVTVIDGAPLTALPSGDIGPQTYNPVPPDLPDGSILLAEVWLAANETTILDSDITDYRLLVQDWDELDADTVDGEEAAVFMHLAGTETVTGDKTFSGTLDLSGAVDFSTAIPTMPATAPSSDDEVANKKYVDDQVSALTEIETKIGTYTGNGGVTRQIATGFVCKFVIVSTQVTKNVVFSVGGATVGLTATAIATGTSLTMHATDGFVVDATGVAASEVNENGKTYYYTAIGTS